ncbi:MAG: M23 family metallopeptidase [Sphingomonadales bacterium]|nr:MAG: M23 family metallopeptidase [Sphingomonadales bacterium]
MRALKRIGWGMAVLLLVLAAGFLSLVRITVQPAQFQSQVAEAPTVLPDSSLGYGGRVQPGDRVALIIPVGAVQANQLSDTWGQSRGGGTREHHAIDIMAPRGTPVLAAASGTVEKLFDSVNGGRTIYIRTRDGATVHYYAHLDTIGVAEGQRVDQGDAIATVGNTGSAASGAPHLHFEIKAMQTGQRWWQGTNVNPYPLLARSGG